MTNKPLSIFNQLRPLSVGFDDVFDHFESMFDHPTITNNLNYPPYNIVKQMIISLILRSHLLTIIKKT